MPAPTPEPAQVLQAIDVYLRNAYGAEPPVTVRSQLAVLKSWGAPPAAAAGGVNLSTNSVTVRFGAVAALQNVNVKVASGERRAVIGPNGAGKTTLFDVITGQRRPTSGRVLLDDADVTGFSVWRRARLGLARRSLNGRSPPDGG